MISHDSFEAEFLQSPIPVLVDFFGSFCPPCRLLTPILDELAEELVDQIKIVKLDVEKNGELVQRLGVNAVPTLIVFKNGREVARLIGLQNKQRLLDAIGKVTRD